MNHWNYRVLAHETLHDETYFQIHAVGYDAQEKPVTYTKDGSKIGGENIIELKDNLSKFKTAIQKPILWAGNRFPETYKK